MLKSEANLSEETHYFLFVKALLGDLLVSNFLGKFAIVSILHYEVEMQISIAKYILILDDIRMIESLQYSSLLACSYPSIIIHII